MKSSIDYSSRFRILKGGKISLVVSALLGSMTILSASPSGEQVTSGSATISQNGTTTNIIQSSQKTTINWQNFSIGANEKVNFAQPNANAIALNRVVGNEKSVISGALNANGQVWILNSNGVLFNSSARVNTAGLVATTAQLSDADFNAGNYNFKNATVNSVVNQGTIEIVNGGSVVLASKEVRNSGTIKAVKGKVHLTGASDYTINLNGNSLVNLTVNKGVLDAMVENSGTIIANGGEIYLTTNAVDELLKGVVNNTGIIEANSLDGVTGKVELFAHGGTATVDGTLEAKGGFIETSAKDLSVKSTAQIKTSNWLLDPDEIVITSSGEDDLTGGSINATAIQNALASANIELQAGEDITVNEDITWDKATKLTLNAGKNIYINAEITALNDNGQLALYTAQTLGGTDTEGYGDYYIHAPINLKAGNNFFTKDGADADVISWKVITNLGSASSTTGTDLQGINGNLTGNFVLGSNIDASTTSSWNSGAGFDPLGDDSNSFSGNFDGLGHTISNLTINRSMDDYIGLFGMLFGSKLQNFGLVDADIKGQNAVGAIAGANYGSIFNVYSTGTISGVSRVGGLTGELDLGIIKNSYSTSNVKGTSEAGGLVGHVYIHNGTIKNSFSLGSVDALSNYGGGFVGLNEGTIENSYSTGEVTGANNNKGGFTGSNSGTITNSYWDAQTSGIATDTIDGTTAVYSTSSEADAFNQAKYTGFDFTNDWFILEGDTRPFLRSMYSTTISNKYQLQLMNMDLTADYKLQNDIDLSGVKIQSDIWNTAKGWRAIGNNTTPFTGNFNANDYTISNLYINRHTTGYQGLFGKINNSQISNIKLAHGDISGSTDTGSIVGMATGDSSLSNITVTNTTIAAGPSAHIGGIVGTFNGTQISNVKFSDGDISGGNDVGGIVGLTRSGNIINAISELGQINAPNSMYAGGISGGIETDNGVSVEISNSGSSMDIHGSSFVGGLVGYFGGNAGISYSVYLGIIEGNQYTGGLVGYMDYWGNGYQTPYIKNSLSLATITVPDMSDAGGLVGIANSGSLIENSYFAGHIGGDMNGGIVGTVSGIGNEIKNTYYDKTLNPNATDPGDTGKTTAELQDIATFENAGWDIVADDTIDSSYKYPVLSVFTQNPGNSVWKIYGVPTPEPETPNTPNTPNTPDTPQPQPEHTQTNNNDVEKVVTTIVNTNSIKTKTSKPLTNPLVPNTMGLRNFVVINGSHMSFVSTPKDGEVLKPVSINEVKTLMAKNGSASENSGATPANRLDTRVPLNENSIVDLLNGGVNLPEGVEQEFYIVKNENGDNN